MPSDCNGIFTHLGTVMPWRCVVNGPRGCRAPQGIKNSALRLKIHISLPCISTTLQGRGNEGLG